MLGFFSQKITNMTNHYIDWSRIGNLIRSGNHKYSSSEILTRGAIISFTAATAFLGYYFNNSKKTNYSDASAAFVCGMIGFVLSHTVVIAPLIKKRCDVSSKCNAMRNQIEEKISSDENKPFASRITEVIDRIYVSSLSDADHSRASATWGRRLALLTQIQESFLLPREKFAELWIDDVDLIINKLSDQRVNKGYRLR